MQHRHVFYPERFPGNVARGDPQAAFVRWEWVTPYERYALEMFTILHTPRIEVVITTEHDGGRSVRMWQDYGALPVVATFDTLEAAVDFAEERAAVRFVTRYGQALEAGITPSVLPMKERGEDVYARWAAYRNDVPDD